MKGADTEPQDAVQRGSRRRLKRSWRFATVYVTGCASDLATVIADYLDRRHIAARRSWWRHLPEPYRAAYLEHLSSLRTFRAERGNHHSGTFARPSREGTGQ
jgi:hypothetical protein